VLDLGENKLGPAFPHVSSMVSLQHLHLPSNRISALPAEQVPYPITLLLLLTLTPPLTPPLPLPLPLTAEQVQALTALQTLDIKENDVPTLPPQLSQLGRLTALSISGNPIRTVPQSVQQAGTGAVLALLAKRMPL
jgi:Leucine-rich repeat (LRR) protein